MKEFQYVIKDEAGIHARPAGMLAKEAKNFKSKITLVGNGREADALRLMAVMSLGLKQGAEMTIRGGRRGRGAGRRGHESFPGGESVRGAGEQRNGYSA